MMAKQSGDPTYTLTCDNCQQPYLSQEGFPAQQLCPACKKKEVIEALEQGKMPNG